MVQAVEAQYNILFQKKCVSSTTFCFSSFSCLSSLPLPSAPSHFFFPCSTSSFLFFKGVFSHNIIHFDHLILKDLSSPYTFHVSLILLTPRASEIVLINGDGVNGVFKGAQHLRQRSFRNPLLLIKILVSNNSCP